MAQQKENNAAQIRAIEQAYQKKIIAYEEANRKQLIAFEEATTRIVQEIKDEFRHLA